MKKIVFFYKYHIFQNILLPKYYRFLLRNKTFKVENSIIIISDARGGSTWLTEMILKIPKTLLNWEPLHPEKGQVPKDFNWKWHPIVHKNSDKNKIKQYLTDILSFKKFNAWSTRYLNIELVQKAEIIVTKFVRAHLLLPFLIENFKFKHKPILLLRHPIALALSQLKAFPHLNNFEKIEIENYKDFKNFYQFKNFISKINDPLEKQITKWCIIYTHQKQLNEKNYLKVYYENLVLNPKLELEKINKELGIQIPIDSIDFTKASKTNFFGDLEDDKTKQLSKWQERINDHQKESIQSIFDFFEIKIYNSKEAFPQSHLQ